MIKNNKTLTQVPRNSVYFVAVSIAQRIIQGLGPLQININSRYVEIKCELDATDNFYCRSYCLLNMLQQPENRTHNPQLHTIPAT